MPVGIRKPLSAVVVSLCVLVGALVFSATPALAAEHYGALAAFGSTGSGAGQLQDPAGVAVNDATAGPNAGDVYVVDKGNDRVEVFSSAGVYLFEFNGSGSNPIVEGSGSPLGVYPGQFIEPEGIAVDNSTEGPDPSKGDVYVIDKGHDVIDKFSESGSYLGQIAGTCQNAGDVPPSCHGFAAFVGLPGVAVDSKGVVWVENGEVFVPGAPASNAALDTFSGAQPNAFLASHEEVLKATNIRPGLAVDSEDDVYLVYGFERYVFKLSSTGEIIGRTLDGIEGASGVAVDPATNDLLIDSGASVVVLNAESLEEETFGVGPLQSAGSLAVDPTVGPSGYAYVAEPADNDLLIFEHSATPPSAPSAPTTGTATEVTAATWTLHGELNPKEAPNGVGYYFSYHAGAGASCTEPGSLSTPLNDGGSNLTGKTAVKVESTVALLPHETYAYCLVEDRFGTTPGNGLPLTTGDLPPTVISESVSGVNASEAHLEAIVNPSNEPAKCRFQYGTATVSEHEVPCEQPTIEGGEQGVGVTVTGLQQNTTYEYRVVIKNATGEATGPTPAEKFTTTIHTETPQQLKAEPVTATEATLHGVLNPREAGDAGYYEFLYRPSAGTPPACHGIGETKSPAEPTTEAMATGAKGESAETKLTGLNPNTQYTACLHVHSEFGEEATSSPVTFTTLVAPLKVESESYSGLAATEARLEATIYDGNSEATYHFEYGTSAGSYDASVPAIVAHTQADLTAVNVDAVATGLQPGTTYHYRVVGSNALPGDVDGADQEFTTPAAQGGGSPSGCPNEKLRAEQPFGAGLPDCRAYEMVSPLETNGNDATDWFLQSPPRAAVSGEAVTYASKGDFADPAGDAFENQFLSRRGPDGWSTQAITPLHHAESGETFPSYETATFTPELTEGIASTNAALTSEGVEGHGLFSFYVDNFATGTYRYVGEAISGDGLTSGASTDLSHIVIHSGEPAYGGNISEWVNGQVVPVSVTNKGENFAGDVGELGAAPYTSDGSYEWRAVSADGSRVYFTRGEGSFGGVYLRENAEQPQSPMSGEECTVSADACTIEASASQRRVADPHGPRVASYWDASTDGSRVFFTSSAELTEDAYTGPADNAENLYEYDLERPVGKRLKDLTVDKTDVDGAAVQGVVQASEDGSYVYFVADGDLGGKAVSGQPNLYVSHDDGAPVFIATLAAKNDEPDWSTYGPQSHTAVVAPDGSHLAFISELSLTGYDNEQAEPGQCEGPIHGLHGGAVGTETGKCREIYVYDAVTNGLVCASCNPSGARPVATSNFVRYHILNHDSYLPRNLLDDGTLFFDSSDALVPHASDGRENVYEYENGHVYPISDVAGGYESFFMDASADGNNVFFGSADQLVPQDTSNSVVVYDARVDGGFPVMAAPPACTNADSCKPPVSPQPSVFAPTGSATFNGIGNYPPPPSKVQKVTKKTVKCKQRLGKNKKGKCIPKKSKKKATRASNKRRASR